MPGTRTGATERPLNCSGGIPPVGGVGGAQGPRGAGVRGNPCRDAGGCGRCGCGIAMRCRDAHGRGRIPALGPRRGPRVSLVQDSPSGLAGASPWLCGRMSASRCWRSLRHAASYRGCRRGLAAAFRGRPSGAWILALEPLWGPSVLSGQEFPSGLARGSPWLCEPFSGFARFRRCCEVLCSVPA